MISIAFFPKVLYTKLDISFCDLGLGLVPQSRDVGTPSSLVLVAPRVPPTTLFFHEKKKIISLSSHRQKNLFLSQGRRINRGPLLSLNGRRSPNAEIRGIYKGYFYLALALDSSYPSGESRCILAIKSLEWRESGGCTGARHADRREGDEESRSFYREQLDRA